MLKKVFLASTMSFLMVGVALTAMPTESYAFSHCHKMAKAKFGPHHRKERHAYVKACRAHFKAAKKAAKK